MSNKPTNPFEALPSRLKYYLLDYKDRHLDEILKEYNKGSLREFTKEELQELFESAVKHDAIYFNQ